MAKSQVKSADVNTIVVDNFGGRLTRYKFGDINSGLAKYATTFGNEPYGSPGNLTWHEAETQIDPSGLVITDLIVAGKSRVESAITYVYAIGHTGRFYKIQVNDPTTYNPNYDNPILLATLSINAPTWKRGGSLEFYGTTERVYIGHDKGVTQINFDGTGEAFVGALGSWTQDVPRPSKQFLGKLYHGNGNNLSEIDSTGLVTTYTKLSPSFPLNTQTRDLDLSVDGNYLQAVVSRLALPDVTSGVQDTTLLGNTESFIFWWNGSDTGYTSSQSFPSFSLTANHTFGDKQYTFGYDISGAVVYSPSVKILGPILTQSPLPNAVGSSGGFMAWQTTEFVQGFMRASLFLYGHLDTEVTLGWWRQHQHAAQGGELDVMSVPWSMQVSNLLQGSVLSGYSNGQVGTAKVYYSTLETSPAPTTKYKLWRVNVVPTGTGTAVAGLYETQNQIFPKKVTASEVRIYTIPLVANNGFTIQLIGQDGNAITNTTKNFTVGSNANIGDDRVWYNPGMAPTQSIGIRIINTGSVNMTILKVELDITPAGE